MGVSSTKGTTARHSRALREKISRRRCNKSAEVRRIGEKLLQARILDFEERRFDARNDFTPRQERANFVGRIAIFFEIGGVKKGTRRLVNYVRAQHRHVDGGGGIVGCIPYLQHTIEIAVRGHDERQHVGEIELQTPASARARDAQGSCA